MKKTINIKISRVCRAPLFVLNKWKDTDSEIPLVFNLDGAVSKLYVRPLSIELPNSFKEAYQFLFELYFENVPTGYKTILQSKSKKAYEFAERIYSYFIDTCEKVEASLRTTGNVKNLFMIPIESFDEFFDNKFAGYVTYTINDSEPCYFIPKIPKRKGLFDLYKLPQQVTPDKWDRMRKEIAANNIPTEEVLELLRLWSKLDFSNEQRLATVESAIFIEAALRNYAKKILQKKGFSRNKIDDFSNDLTFNIVLNLILPLTLTNSERRNIMKDINQVNKLRKKRNDIIHDNIDNNEIDKKEMKQAIESSIRIIKCINKKSL